jgi:hypothetical protein
MSDHELPVHFGDFNANFHALLVSVEQNAPDTSSSPDIWDVSRKKAPMKRLWTEDDDEKEHPEQDSKSPKITARIESRALIKFISRWQRWERQKGGKLESHRKACVGLIYCRTRRYDRRRHARTFRQC